MPNRIVWETNEISPKLAGMKDTLDRALTIFMEYQSPKVQDYMRTNAPWTDRTGNARGGLFARAVEHSIVCYHTVPYGIWLEVAHDGNYRIIEPTIQVEGKRIMGDIDQLMSMMAAVD